MCGLLYILVTLSLSFKQARPAMPLTTMGWGAIAEGGLSPSVLTAVRLPLVPVPVCRNYMSPYR